MRRVVPLLVLFVTFGAMGLVWLRSRDSSASAPPPPEAAATPIIIKEPPVVSTRRFNPAAPPPDMPPLHAGEQAQCESNFMSSAIVSGQPHRISVNGAMVAITQVRMTLQLAITIWVPDDVTVKVLEHEEGHRQISEFYYQTADQLAARVAASYIGRQIEITSGDLDAEGNKLLQDVGAEITDEYSKQLNPDAAQHRYDEITDHARNDVLVKDAVAQALKE